MWSRVRNPYLFYCDFSIFYSSKNRNLGRNLRRQCMGICSLCSISIEKSRYAIERHLAGLPPLKALDHNERLASFRSDILNNLNLTE